MSDNDPKTSLQWYVIHTHSRQEERAASNLRVQKVEVFSPKFLKRQYNEFTGNPSYLSRPLFPGYIFGRLNIEALLHKVRYTRGVHSLVSFNNRPMPVDDELITLMQARLTEDGFIKMDEDLKPGDKVVIREGMFKIFTGVFEAARLDTDRVTILLNTINYSFRALVNKDLVKKIGEDETSISSPVRQ